MKTTLFKAFFAAIFLCIIAASCSLAKNASLSIGSAVPGLKLPSLMGHELDLSSTRGKPAILTFFASWSRPCLDGLKFLQALRSNNKDVEIIAVSFDGKPSAVSAFMKENGLSMTTLIDRKKQSLDDFQILVIPTTYLIDKNGVLKNIYVDFDDSVRDSILKDVSEL